MKSLFSHHVFILSATEYRRQSDICAREPERAIGPGLVADRFSKLCQPNSTVVPKTKGNHKSSSDSCCTCTTSCSMASAACPPKSASTTPRHAECPPSSALKLWSPLQPSDAWWALPVDRDAKSTVWSSRRHQILAEADALFSVWIMSTFKRNPPNKSVETISSKGANNLSSFII